MTQPSETLTLSESTFPFRTVLSFLPIIEYWRVKTNDPSKALSLVARHIAKELEQAPELLEPIDDFSVLEKHYELVGLLMSRICRFIECCSRYRRLSKRRTRQAKGPSTML